MWNFDEELGIGAWEKHESAKLSHNTIRDPFGVVQSIIYDGSDDGYGYYIDLERPGLEDEPGLSRVGMMHKTSKGFEYNSDNHQFRIVEKSLSQFTQALDELGDRLGGKLCFGGQGPYLTRS